MQDLAPPTSDTYPPQEITGEHLPAPVPDPNTNLTLNPNTNSFCQHLPLSAGACCTASAAVGRYFLPAGRSAANPPAVVAAVDGWDRDGRTPDRFIASVAHTMRAASITCPSYPWRNAASREHWRSIVDTTAFKQSMS